MAWANHSDVLRQLRAIGLLIPGGVLELAQGDRSRRCLVEGGDKEKRGWYRLHEWEIEPGVTLLVGSYGISHGDNRGTLKVELTKTCAACSANIGLREKQCMSCGASTFRQREFSAEQKAAFTASMAEHKRRAAAEQAGDAERASQWSTTVWRAITEVQPAGHGYLVRKQLSLRPGLTPVDLRAAPIDREHFVPCEQQNT